MIENFQGRLRAPFFFAALAASEHALQRSRALGGHLKAARAEFEQATLLEALQRKPIQFARVKLAFRDVAERKPLGWAKANRVLSVHGCRLWLGGLDHIVAGGARMA